MVKFGKKVACLLLNKHLKTILAKKASYIDAASEVNYILIFKKPCNGCFTK